MLHRSVKGDYPGVGRREHGYLLNNLPRWCGSPAEVEKHWLRIIQISDSVTLCDGLSRTPHPNAYVEILTPSISAGGPIHLSLKLNTQYFQTLPNEISKYCQVLPLLEILLCAIHIVSMKSNICIKPVIRLYNLFPTVVRLFSMAFSQNYLISLTLSFWR